MSVLVTSFVPNPIIFSSTCCSVGQPIAARSNSDFPFVGQASKPLSCCHKGSRSYVSSGSTCQLRAVYSSFLCSPTSGSVCSVVIPLANSSAHHMLSYTKRSPNPKQQTTSQRRLQSQIASIYMMMLRVPYFFHQSCGDIMRKQKPMV